MNKHVKKQNSSMTKKCGKKKTQNLKNKLRYYYLNEFLTLFLASKIEYV